MGLAWLGKAVEEAQAFVLLPVYSTRGMYCMQSSQVGWTLEFLKKFWKTFYFGQLNLASAGVFLLRKFLFVLKPKGSRVMLTLTRILPAINRPAGCTSQNYFACTLHCFCLLKVTQLRFPAFETVFSCFFLNLKFVFFFVMPPVYTI